MGFSARRWLLSVLTRRRLGATQYDWKHLRFSYSQFGEDLVVAPLLPGATGFYVDIGCYHPVALSNTYALYRRGWRGLVVDANPLAIQRFRKRRPRDIAIQAALSDHPSDRIFEVVAAAESCHLRDETREPPRPDDEGAQIKQLIPIRTTTLAELLHQHLPDGQSIDLLSIDCEREDLAVLRSNDWERFRPGVIIVEDFHWVAEQSPIVALLKENGYELIATVSLSRIFLTRERYLNHNHS